MNHIMFTYFSLGTRILALQKRKTPEHTFYTLNFLYNIWYQANTSWP